jgi:hypothetical protein
LEQGKYYRVTTLVVICMFVFSLAWLEGCGGYIVGGGSSSSSLTGTAVDVTTKKPVAGAVVVLEQADASGTDRVVASTVSGSNGSFSFNASASGTYDVVADAVVTSTTAATVTYAATVTFGVPASTKLGQIPLVPEFGSSTPTGTPVPISAIVSSSGTMMGAPIVVDVELSALQSVSPAVGSVNRITIPVFAGSIASVTTTQSLSSCAPGTACAGYTLIVPAANFAFGIFSASGTQYNIPVQQPNVNYTAEGRAFFRGASLTQDCTPSSLSSGIVIVNGSINSANPDLPFTGCL